MKPSLPYSACFLKSNGNLQGKIPSAKNKFEKGRIQFAFIAAE
jgi:hypothetical protein